MIAKKKIKIIPAIDIIGGKCVRLTKGDYAQEKVYDSSPLDMARRFEDCGISSLHLVDLDGAKASSPVNLDTLEKIKTSTSLKVEFGGGVKSTEALNSVIDSGADWVITGSVAVTAPQLLEEWTVLFPGKIVLGVDLKDGHVATRGWLDKSTHSYSDVITRFPAVRRIIVTEISRDGTLQGVDLCFYEKVQAEYPDKEITVSGGIASASDILSLEDAGLKSVIVGKAIYEGRISLKWISDIIGKQ